MEKIKNIILDYGNVIFEINFKRTQNALYQLGITVVEHFFSHKSHHQLFNDFETSNITAATFRNGIRNAANNQGLSDTEIDKAWNSLLIGVSANNHDILLNLKDKYRTFLLSNNNEIHYNWIIDYLKKEFEMENYDQHFEKAYFSQLMGLRKPNAAIFEQVMIENNLNNISQLLC
jgi:putative hydrolase of the HAD superfamily